MIEIIRTCNSDMGTFGTLIKDNIPLCVTCELPDPIPEGEYDCIVHSGLKFSNVWEITNVKGHSSILIHWGNTINDTKLCVLVGKSFAHINGKPGITNSRLTIDQLRGVLPSTFKLKIRNAF